ncbi:dihydrolipoamide acetyltransferase family protein [Actinomadura flavalba]|uniref:dihydrolipoamide acetyltransferase family protein n=1 Tax=Actinomadura flavalba TaxID=1120938 RepID=UPI0005267BD6|nr:dihydrolipoamide acetyltransferase family protein [Actinomadura flavalba]
MATKQFKLPDVGEGLTEAEIVKWHVAVGDTVEINQTIVEIETAKAIVELPCPFEGVVSELLADEGVTVDVGVPIISVDVGGDSSGAEAVPREEVLKEDLVPDAAEEAAADAEPEQAKRQPVLVGYGVKPGATKRRQRKGGSVPGSGAGAEAGAGLAGAAHAAGEAHTGGATHATGAAHATGATGAGHPPPAQGGDPTLSVQCDTPPPSPTTEPVDNFSPLAKPPVRKMAKDLGVDLRTLRGTGPNGSITRDDVQAATGNGTTAPTPPAQTGPPVTAPSTEPAPHTPPVGDRVPLKGVRKAMAAAMAQSAFTAPHVTMFHQVDVTETMATARRLRELPDFADVKVSPLLLVAKALLVAVRRHPIANARFDGDAVVMNPSVNLGIAAATDRGLIVPNIKDAQSKTLPELATALKELTETARAGRTTPAAMSGGTITITNIGVFGIDTGTPILTPGESAILAFGQIRDLPWVHEGELAIRKISALALSFDHRVLDGAEGSAVLHDIATMLENPLQALAWT